MKYKLALYRKDGEYCAGDLHRFDATRAADVDTLENHRPQQ
jgi:hypothetical protein